MPTAKGVPDAKAPKPKIVKKGTTVRAGLTAAKNTGTRRRG